jgi:hypothetical protein
MSKFQDLIGLYHQYDNDVRSYRDRSRAMMTAILVGFEHYLEAPKDTIKFFPPSDTDRERKTYAPQGALELSDDGWWEADFVIRPAGLGAELSFRFRLFTATDHFLAQVGANDNKHRITQPTKDQLTPIWEEAFTTAEKWLSTGIERFIEQNEQGKDPAKIGFF